MKLNKLVALLAALILLCFAAQAEETNERIPQETLIPENIVIPLDLDGDGLEEKVSWKEIWADEYTQKCIVTVVTNENDILTYTPEFEYTVGVYARDLDGDGRTEFLISGDLASSDYITICLHLFNGRLEPALFADCSRTNYNRGYDKWGYGMVTAIDGNLLTLSGSQDILGTWNGERTFTLADTGIFEFADDGRWIRDPSEPLGDMWEFAGLTAAQALACTMPNGAKSILPAGTRLMIIASDKQTAEFITDKGVHGTLSIYPDETKGWGFYVDNRPEEEAFGYIPYYD